MEGNEEYEFIHTIRRQLDKSADKIIEEILLTGQSTTEKKPRSVHSVIPCFTKLVN